MLSFTSFWNYVDICSQDTKLFKDNWKVNTGTLICLGLTTIKVIYYVYFDVLLVGEFFFFIPKTLPMDSVLTGIKSKDRFLLPSSLIFI